MAEKGERKRGQARINPLPGLQHFAVHRNPTWADVAIDLAGAALGLALAWAVVRRWALLNEPNLGEPHTKAFGEGLFEMRLKGAEGIARVFFCTLVGKRIVMLHSFVKKTDRTPLRELEIAQNRMKEFKHANP